MGEGEGIELARHRDVFLPWRGGHDDILYLFCRSAAGAILVVFCSAGQPVLPRAVSRSTMRNLFQLLKTNFGALVGGRQGWPIWTGRGERGHN